MITFTRKDARAFRNVMRRTLGVRGKATGPPVLFSSSSAGLVVRAANSSAAVEYRVTGKRPDSQVLLPYAALADIQGNRANPVNLDIVSGQVTAAWQDGAVSQVKQYDQPSDTSSKSWPPVPDQLCARPASLLTALRDAMETTDTESSRYALSCVQLCGDKGRLVSTDGRHLLIQRGLDLPWNGQVYLPHNSVFTAKELYGENTLKIGVQDDWLTIVIGSWSLHFALLQDARFPDVDSIVPDIANSKSNIQLVGGDCDFLTDNLKRLPSKDGAVTVDLNGEVVVRGRGPDKTPPSELVLSNSTTQGKAVRFNTNRQYLDRAARLGFRVMHVFDRESPVVCIDERRTYLWAVLTADDAVEPNQQATRIKSPIEHRCSTATNQQPTKDRKEPMPTDRNRLRGASSDNGNGRVNGHATENEGDHPDDVLDQAETLKTTLKEVTRQMTDLVAALKRQRKQHKTLRSTLASLRQLQRLDL